MDLRLMMGLARGTSCGGRTPSAPSGSARRGQPEIGVPARREQVTGILCRKNFLRLAQERATKPRQRRCLGPPSKGADSARRQEIGASRRRSLRKTIKLERKCVHRGRQDDYFARWCRASRIPARLGERPDQIPHERAQGGVAPMLSSFTLRARRPPARGYSRQQCV